jgi:WD40-like Beta Propeller Repeat
MRRATGIATLVGLLVPAAAHPAAATSPGRNGRIFFSSRPPIADASGCGVASMRPDGTGFNCVDPFGRDPAVSPDNKRLVSVRGDALVEVYASDINGKGVKRLTRAPGESPSSLAPSFTPNSRSILFDKHFGDEGVNGLYLMNADGSGQRQLTSDRGVDPVFSPSGAQIAYGTTGLAIANADGGASHLILTNQNTTSAAGRYFETNGEPTWAPSGRQIAFSRHTATTSFACTPIPDCIKPVLADHLYVINADGTGIRQLTSTPGMQELDPSWSPDGRRIAYYRRPQNAGDERGEVWVMNADGTGQKRLALGANPEWSSLQGGPKKPVLSFQSRRIDRRRPCYGRFDGWFVRVKTTALRYTGFNIHFIVDGKVYDEIFNTRSRGDGIDQIFPRRKRHKLKVVIDDPVVHDRVSHTYTLRRC